MRAWILAAIAAVTFGGAARAEVVETNAQGFRLKTVRQINAPPAKVYKAIGEIGRWWDGEHSYSGKAENITMPLQANACWCEAIPGGGSVRHGVVVLAWEAQGMIDALAPLLEGGRLKLYCPESNVAEAWTRTAVPASPRHLSGRTPPR